jgi:hypothetical protein
MKMIIEKKDASDWQIIQGLPAVNINFDRKVS